MNSKEAREILALYRPGTADAEDPQVIEAVGVARQDPELARWFEQHCAFQQAMRAKFRQIQVPPHLKLALAARRETALFRPGWHRPAWLAAGATAVALLALTAIWYQPHAPNQFANFQTRMIGAALRQYRMDIETNDMAQVRQFLVARGAPGDYDLTRGLERLQLKGGGVLRWRNNPVSMVCFNRGDNETLYLFVMDRASLKDPPSETPQVSRLHEQIAASWSRGRKTYVLAGPEEAGFLEKYM